VLEGAWADSQGAYAGDFYAHWNGPVPGCPACGTELQWLKTDLAAHANTPFKFAFFHYPLYSDSPTQSSDTYLQGPNGLEGLLAQNNVNIVFNGHAHHYERNYPQIAGSPMVSYITGGGGDALGSIGCSSFDAYAIASGRSCRAPTPTSSAQVFHFLLVTVSGNTVTVTPTDSTGRTFDVQTYTTSAANVTTIDSGPASLTNATTATFTFHSTAPGASFTCKLDGSSASPCASGVRSR
jgi:Calcineurin-like phosphoesterase